MKKRTYTVEVIDRGTGSVYEDANGMVSYDFETKGEMLKKAFELENEYGSDMEQFALICNVIIEVGQDTYHEFYIDRNGYEDVEVIDWFDEETDYYLYR